MDQLAMLWQYQVEDRKADKLEQELSRSPLRQKMNTCRTQFNAKQKQYKQMEEQVAILSDRKDAIRDAITRCEEQLRHLQSRFEQNPPKALLSEVNRFLETIGSYEQEMKRMAKDANDYDQKERSLRRDAIKLKEEFDNLKKQYDKESPEKEAALKAQKAIVAKKGEGISPELLARYHEIKKRITPPLARLIAEPRHVCQRRDCGVRKLRASADSLILPHMKKTTHDRFSVRGLFRMCDFTVHPCSHAPSQARRNSAPVPAVSSHTISK